VICYRKLAENVGTCLRKGDPVVVRGRVSVREFEDKKGAQRTAVEVDATSVGHDLSRGVAQFQRVRPQTGMTAQEFRSAENGADGGEGSDEAAFASLAAAAAGDPGAGGADGATGSPGDGGPVSEMFDEDAVGVLAEQASGAAAPF
jgi:single-strand DNA-binding protein